MTLCCKFFGRGVCRQGDKCWFIHPTDAFTNYCKSLPDKRNTSFNEICCKSLFKNCHDQSCRYIHVSDDVRYVAAAVHDDEVTKLQVELAESRSVIEVIRGDALQKEERSRETVRYAARLKERLEASESAVARLAVIERETVRHVADLESRLAVSESADTRLAVVEGGLELERLVITGLRKRRRSECEDLGGEVGLRSTRSGCHF